MTNKEEKTMVDSQSGNFETNEYDKINLYDLWKVIIKRKIIIIGIFLISLLVATIYCFTAPEIYQIETLAKLFMPKELMHKGKDPLTAKDISLIIGKIDPEKKAIIFTKYADVITNVKINDIRGATDKLKITIESSNREILPVAMQEMIRYIENIREMKSNYEKIILEFDERIKNVKEAVKKNDFQIREIEKRLSNAKLLPVGFNPIEINIKSIDLKMEKFLLKQERQNYKMVRPLEDPFISQYPIKPKKAFIITIAGLCGFIFGIFIVFIMEKFERKRVKIKY